MLECKNPLLRLEHMVKLQIGAQNQNKNMKYMWIWQKVNKKFSIFNYAPSWSSKQLKIHGTGTRLLDDLKITWNQIIEPGFYLWSSYFSLLCSRNDTIERQQPFASINTYLKAGICVTQTTISAYSLSRANEAVLWKTAGNCFVGSCSPPKALPWV